MIKMILKKAFILSLPLFSLNVFSDELTHKELLAKQCVDLSRSIFSLIANQDNNLCAERLILASNEIKKAGLSILIDDMTAAKQQLSGSVSALQQAELSSCSQYIQISHSKYEANKIRHSL